LVEEEAVLTASQMEYRIKHCVLTGNTSRGGADVARRGRIYGVRTSTYANEMVAFR
jgi:hypothetical protein